MPLALRVTRKPPSSRPHLHRDRMHLRHDCPCLLLRRGQAGRSHAACHAARTQSTAHRAGCLGAMIVSSGDGVPPAMSAKRAQRVGRVRMRKVGRSATFHVAMPRCTATCHDATPLSHVATWHAVAPCARAARNVSLVLRRPRARQAPCERDGATGNARVWPSRSIASATIRSSPSCVLVTSLPRRPPSVPLWPARHAAVLRRTRPDKGHYLRSNCRWRRW